MMDERTNERTYGRVDKEISGFYFHPRVERIFREAAVRPLPILRRGGRKVEELRRRQEMDVDEGKEKNRAIMQTHPWHGVQTIR